MICHKLNRNSKNKYSIKHLHALHFYQTQSWWVKTESLAMFRRISTIILVIVTKRKCNHLCSPIYHLSCSPLQTHRMQWIYHHRSQWTWCTILIHYNNINMKVAIHKFVYHSTRCMAMIVCPHSNIVPHTLHHTCLFTLHNLRRICPMPQYCLVLLNYTRAIRSCMMRWSWRFSRSWHGYTRRWLVVIPMPECVLCLRH